MDWEDIKTFKEVATHKTVRSAARILGVHHSTVSRRVENLEKAVGARLFDRSPDGYGLTTAGEVMLEAAQRFNDELLFSHRQISGMDDLLTGTLTVTMAEPLAVNVFAPRLSEFTEAHPGLELEIITSMDFLDVSRREADIAIRMDNNPPETLVGKRLFPYCETVYATANYLAARNLKAKPESGRWLRWNKSDKTYPDWAQDTEFAGVPAWGYFPDINLQRAAVRNGLGLTILPCLLGDSDPLLVRASKQPPKPARDIWILTHSDLRRTTRIKAFMAFAETVLRGAKGQLMGVAS